MSVIKVEKKIANLIIMIEYLMVRVYNLRKQTQKIFYFIWKPKLHTLWNNQIPNNPKILFIFFIITLLLVLIIFHKLQLYQN